MSFEIEVQVKKEIVVCADPNRVFDLLADIPRSVSHFPNVEKLIPRGENMYEWVMCEVGAAGLKHRVNYACRYVTHIENLSVTWEPIPGIGNAVFSGQWLIQPQSVHSLISFETQARLHIPAPRLIRKAIAPIADKTLRSQIDQYISNLQKSFSALG